MEFPGGGGSTARPSGTENPGGWGVKLEKPSVGGVWIFSGTTQLYLPVQPTLQQAVQDPPNGTISVQVWETLLETKQY